MHVHLLEEPGPVGGDGFVAEVETFGDFPHGLAFCDHEHHLAFTVREPMMKGFGGIEIHFEGQFFGDAVVDVFSSAGHFVDGGDQLVGAAGPGEISGSAPTKHPDGQIIVIPCGVKHKDRQRGGQN